MDQIKDLAPWVALAGLAWVYIDMVSFILRWARAWARLELTFAAASIFLGSVAMGQAQRLKTLWQGVISWMTHAGSPATDGDPGRDRRALQTTWDLPNIGNTSNMDARAFSGA